MGPLGDTERARVLAGSPVGGKYDIPVDRESAAEMLARKAETVAARADAPAAPAPAPQAGGDGIGDRVNESMWGSKRRQGAVQTMGKQVARTVGSQIGRRIVRGILGGMFGGR